MGDHRYNQQKTPVQSAIDYLRCNSQNNRQSINQSHHDNTQNIAYYENRAQQLPHIDNYQMQQLANQRYHNQMQGCFFNSTPLYQFAEPTLENNVPYQTPSNMQYFENNNMQNQQVYPPQYHSNYYMGQNNNLSTSTDHNLSQEFKLKFDAGQSSNDSLVVQKEYFPELSEDRSNEDSQEQVLLNLTHHSGSLNRENYNRTSAETHYIQEPLVNPNCYTLQNQNINTEKNFMPTNTNSNHANLNAFLLNVSEIESRSARTQSFIHNAEYTVEAGMN